jgi:hypothetical protein
MNGPVTVPRLASDHQTRQDVNLKIICTGVRRFISRPILFHVNGPRRNSHSQLTNMGFSSRVLDRIVRSAHRNSQRRPSQCRNRAIIHSGS